MTRHDKRLLVNLCCMFLKKRPDQKGFGEAEGTAADDDDHGNNEHWTWQWHSPRCEKGGISAPGKFDLPILYQHRTWNLMVTEKVIDQCCVAWAHSNLEFLSKMATFQPWWFQVGSKRTPTAILLYTPSQPRPRCQPCMHRLMLTTDLGKQPVWISMI